MDVLDEKANGIPPMEIEEVISVHDREPRSVHAPRLLVDIPTYLTDDAFAAKHLPDLGFDVKDFKVFNWTLRGWKKLDKKLTSEEFECGGHRWYVSGMHDSSCDNKGALC